jgi:hypothetical protein
MSNPYLIYTASQRPRYGAWFEAESEEGWFSSPSLKKWTGASKAPGQAKVVTQKPKFYESKAFKIGLISLLVGGVALVGFRSLRTR